MAAPTFVGAGAGVTIASGSAAVTAAGSGVAVGDLVILQVLQDGTAASAVTYSAISGIANLAGTASSLTTLATDQVCGSTAKQHLRVGRATSTTCTVTVATTGDDLYYRIYVFRDVNTGTALTDILENGTAGTIANGSGAVAAVADTSVTTLGADRLALQFIGVDDDNPLGPFTGMTGGTWAEATAEFASATGTDGAIQLQIGGVAYADTAWPAVSGSVFGDLTTRSRKATEFVAPQDGVADILIPLRVVGAPTDDVSIEIQTSLDPGAPASNIPSGTVIAGPVTINVAGTTMTTYVARLQASLTSGATYWVVVGRTGAINASNYYEAGAIGGTFTGATWTGTIWDPDFAGFAFTAFGGMTSGTINGGSYTMAAADNWGVIGFALIPVPSGTAHTATPADTLTLADNVTTESGKTASIGDTLALADALASTAAFARTITDPVTLADAVAFQRDVSLPLADTLSLADLVAAQRGISQALDDTLALADLATTAAGKGVSIADTLALADALSSAGVFQRALTDTVSLVDSLAAQSAYQLSVTDTLALADVLSSQAAFARALADTLTLADLVDPVKGAGGVDHAQPIADTLILADSLSSQAAYLRTLADTLTLADLLTTTGAGAQAISDTLALADALRFDRTLNLADTVALQDALSFQAAYLRTLADTVSLTDAVTAGRELTKALADTVALLDSLAVTLGRAVLLEDTLALTDLVDALLTAAVGAPPRASGRIDFPGVGVITKPTRGSREGAGRGRLDTSTVGVLTKPRKGDLT